MESESHAKDVAALLNRAGLNEGGTYREFPSKQPGVVVAGQRATLPLHPDMGIDQTLAPDVAARAGAFPVRPPTSHEFPLARISPRKNESSYAPTRVAIFSLAGGVGKTTIATALGRILSGRMKRVVLANCDSSFGLQHLHGSHSLSVGPFTFVHAPGNLPSFPLTLIEAGDASSTAEIDNALKRILDSSQQADTLLLDLPANRSEHALECLRAADHILIPLSPDMHSTVTLRYLEELMGDAGAAGQGIHYIINRYDASRPAHREMRDRLRSILGGALLPFPICEEPQIQDAMRMGVTIVDYAPEARVVSDLQGLGKWVEQLLPRSEFVKGMTA